MLLTFIFKIVDLFGATDYTISPIVDSNPLYIFLFLYTFFECGMVILILTLITMKLFSVNFEAIKGYMLASIIWVIMVQLSYYILHILDLKFESSLFRALSSKTGLFDEVEIGIFSTGVLQIKLSFIFLIGILLFFFIWGALTFLQTSSTRHLNYEYLILLLANLLFCSLMLKIKSLFLIWFLLECISISTYLLLAANRNASTYHSYLYFIFNALAGALILFGFNILGVFTIQDLYSNLTVAVFDVGQLYSINFGILIMGLGFFIKLGLVPFHFWALEVYETLTTELMFLLVTLNKAAIILVFALILNMLFASTLILPTTLLIFTALALVSLLLGAVGAFNETNFQRYLVFASLPQVSYVLLGLFTGCSVTASSAIGYFIIYAATLLFLYFILRVIGFKIIYLTDLHAIFFYKPAEAIALLAVFFSLAGLPPFVGFIAKFILLQNLILNGYYGMVLLILVASVISVVYYLRACIILVTLHQRKQFKQNYVNLPPVLIGFGQFGTFIFNTVIVSSLLLILVLPNFYYLPFLNFLLT